MPGGEWSTTHSFRLPESSPVAATFESSPPVAASIAAASPEPVPPSAMNTTTTSASIDCGTPLVSATIPRLPFTVENSSDTRHLL